MGFSAGDIEATLTLDRTPFNRGLALARTDAEKFERQKLEVKLVADADQASFQRAKQQAAALGSREAVSLSVDVDERSFVRAEEREAGLGGQEAVDLRADIDQATFVKAKAEEERLGGTEEVKVKADIDQTSFARVTLLSRAFSALTAEGSRTRALLSGLGGEINPLSGGFKGAGESIGTAAGFLGKWAAILIGVVPLVVSLAAALAALVASAVAAAAGLGALGVAAAAGFGPILALGLLAVVRLTQASAASKAYAAAQQAVTSAAQTLKGAETSLTNAHTAAQQAQGALTRARQQAALQIRSDLQTALDGLRTSEEGVTSANYAAKSAEEQLTQARQQARRAIVDERLAAAGATLSHKQAVLDLAQARRDLATLEGDPSATGLQLRQARLAVQEAELQVKQTRVESGRAQRDLNTAERQGIDGAPAVVSARQAVQQADQGVTDANHALVEAEQKLRTAQAATVNQSPSVISARQAVASADQQVAQAQAQVADAAEKLHFAQSKANKALQAVKDTRAAEALVTVAKHIGSALGAGVDPILRGMKAGLLSLIPVIHALRPGFVVLGEAMGHAFRLLGREFASPAWRRFFAFLLRSSAQIVRMTTPAFLAFLRILRNIATAAMPFLIRGLRDFSHWLVQVARGTRNIDLHGVIGQLGVWLELSKQLGRIFLGFVTALAPQGKGLVGWLTQGAKALADWVNSARGQEQIRKFMADVLPLAKQLVIAFGQLVVIALQLTQALAPLFAPLIQGLNVALGFVRQFLGWLGRINPLLRPLALSFAGLILPIVVLKRLFPGVFRAIASAARTTAHAVVAAWHGVTAGFRAVWSGIRDVARAYLRIVESIVRFYVRAYTLEWRILLVATRAIWNAIQAAVTAIIRATLAVVRAVVGTTRDVVSGGWRAILGVTRTVWQAIKGAVANQVHAVVDVIRSGMLAAVKVMAAVARVFGNIGHAISKVFQSIASVIRKVVHFIVGAVNRVASALNDLKSKLPSISLPSLPSVPGPGDIVGGIGGALGIHARGGLVRTPSYVVGEEAPAHPEIILASNPAYRARNLALWQQAGEMLGVPGYAQGGVRLLPGVNMRVGQEPQILNALRGFAGIMRKVVYVISGYRSPAHSVAVGGFANDPHTQGRAADIGLGSPTLASMQSMGLEHPLNRVGLYRPFYPQSAAEANHVQLLHGMAHGVARAIRALIPRIHVRGSGPLAGLTQTTADRVREAANRYIGRMQSRLAAVTTAGVAGGPGTLSRSQFLSIARQAIGVTHHPEFTAGGLLSLAIQESGLRVNPPPPNDVNTRMGNPSMGLMQITGSNFRAYHARGTSHSIIDPLANIAASILYQVGRYGHQVTFSPYALGGLLPAGRVALVGEDGPELVVSRQSADVIPNRQTEQLLDPINAGLRATQPVNEGPVVNIHINALHPGDSKVYRELAAATAKGVSMQGYRSTPRRAVTA